MSDTKAPLPYCPHCQFCIHCGMLPPNHQRCSYVVGLEVFEIGSHVLIDGEIPAIVTGINIRGMEHRLQYEVTWWDERSRKSEWCEPFEIKPQEAKTKTLSFVPTT